MSDGRSEPGGGSATASPTRGGGEVPRSIVVPHANVAVSVQGVTKRYADQLVLDGVTLSVARGEFLAIEGRSGSGKSTLLNVIGGLDRSFTGEVQVAGAALVPMTETALSRFRNREIGFIFQSFNLLSALTALDNVLLPSFFSSGAGGRESRERAAAALETVGLADKRAKRPGELSGGERQRVAIARALFLRPPLLLCDEPTGNLDAATGAQIIELFAKLNAETGLTLVVVTHELRVASVARRRLYLRRGVLSTEGTAEGAA